MTWTLPDIRQFFAAVAEFVWPAVDPDDRVLTARKRVLSTVSLLLVVIGTLDGVLTFRDTFAYSPPLAYWSVTNAMLYIVPPLLVWHSNRLTLASALMIGYLLLSLNLQSLSPEDHLWDTAIYIVNIPVIGMLLLGPRGGILVSVMAIVNVLVLATATVPGWIALILVNSMIGTAVSLLIFMTEVEKTTEHLGKLHQEAQAASRAKSFFLANVSHEIRTPLNGVIGAVQLLTEHAPGPEEQKKLLNTAHKSGRSLLRIVNDILDFAMITEHEIQLEKITFRREDLITNVFSAYSAEAEKKGIALTHSFDEDVPCYLTGDPERLSQILINYVGNAIKFSEHGTVEARVLRQREPGGGDMVRVEVRDEGIGLSEEAAKRIFDEFEQAENSTARLYGGTGLGLSIARHLAKLHGGTTGVQSTPGEGSTFWFTFPLIEGERPADQAAPSPATQQGQFENARVLVVEDNKTNQFITRKFLSRLGVEPEIASDGIEAVAAAARRQFDLIFMDIQMPRKSGIEATRGIRAGGLNRETPILALSANVMADQKVCYLEAGMNGCLEKPCKFEDIAASLKRHLRPPEGLAAETAPGDVIGTG